MTKVHWLAKGNFFRVNGVLLVRVLAVGVRSANSPANGKGGSVPEEMTQTLLTNKKQGKTVAHKNFFISIENRRSPLKIWRPAANYYLGLDLSPYS
jgi:hypothetical protein